MQNVFIAGNLAADCEVFQNKEGVEMIGFPVAVNDPRAEKDDKPTYYNCRMRKNGLADYLKKGRFVAVSGSLRAYTSTKDDKTYLNLDVWVGTIDLAPVAKEQNAEDAIEPEVVEG